MTTSIVNKRLAALRELCSQREIDGLLVTGPENRRYLSGFTAEQGLAPALLITQDAMALLTDFRYQLWAQQEAPDFQIVIYKVSLGETLAGLLKELRVRRLGFEAAHVTFRGYQRLTETVGSKGVQVEWQPLEGVVEELREAKAPEELAAMRRALEVSEAVLRQVFRELTPGKTERQVAWEIEAGLREGGCESLAFPPIVAAGENSARPHHQPGDRIIEAGEPIIIDMGGRLNGYCADITRTYILGPADEQFRKIYSLVRQAQASAEAKLKAGMDSLDADALARGVIAQEGYGEAFGHSLGHGVGLAVHENPAMSPNPERRTVLKAGSVVTVEPGIYLAGWGGIRLEDMVLLKEDG
ncbi:MAG: aminopeptidase P family protein, partial [Deltaproteobacteria bacterium]|nr:aminopeptidase P family protein [Deltaproteobacteria bacterium]